jgi:hypothetical protein
MATLVVSGLFALWAVLFLAHSRLLRAIWREPVFRLPVLVLESDDWGAGPAEQSIALDRLRDLLLEFHDETGRPAMMTLGLVLQTADRDAMRSSGDAGHMALGLDEPQLAAVLDAIRRGQASGVFAPQLHGLAHYWEASLVSPADETPAVQEWLAGSGPGWTEELPAALQSRWIDARTLPSRALPPAEIATAIAAEVTAWQRIFNALPAVAVPTTFIWNEAVEKAYAAAGVHALMTPGVRFIARDEAGQPMRSGPPLFNGEYGCGNIMYLVRDVYFEPVLGHAAERLPRELVDRTKLGRPALVETHRFNFCGPRANDAAFAILTEGLRLVRERMPNVRFLSSAELACAIEAGDPRWLERRLLRRCAIWAHRALCLPGFGRAARACGLAWPLRALGACA